MLRRGVVAAGLRCRCQAGGRAPPGAGKGDAADNGAAHHAAEAADEARTNPSSGLGRWDGGVERAWHGEGYVVGLTSFVKDLILKVARGPPFGVCRNRPGQHRLRWRCSADPPFAGPTTQRRRSSHPRGCTQSFFCTKGRARIRPRRDGRPSVMRGASKFSNGPIRMPVVRRSVARCTWRTGRRAATTLISWTSSRALAARTHPCLRQLAAQATARPLIPTTRDQCGGAARSPIQSHVLWLCQKHDPSP